MFCSVNEKPSIARSAAIAVPALPIWNRPESRGNGRSSSPACVLIDQAAVFLIRLPVLAMDHKRCADNCRAAVRWRHARRHSAGPVYRSHPASEMPAFSPAIAGHGVAEKIPMVKIDGRNHGERWAFNDVGGVEPAAKPGLQKHGVGRVAGERQPAPQRW